jgi:hypothetical protein
MWCPHGKTESVGCDAGCEVFEHNGIDPPTVYKVIIPFDTTKPGTMALACNKLRRAAHKVPVNDVLDYYDEEHLQIYLLCNLRAMPDDTLYLDVIQAVTEEEY